MRIACYHLNQIGDLAFALPALKSIRDSSPDAHITSIARPGAVELLECTGLVDDVLVRRGGMNRAKLDLIRELAARKFDLAIVFSQSAECAALAFLSRTPKRIGFINTSGGFLLTKQVAFAHPPSTENNLRLISEAGFGVTCREYTRLLKPSDAQLRRAEELLRAKGVRADEPYVVFSPGTSGRRSVKEWTEEGFASVAQHLTGQGYRVLIVGTQPSPGILAGCPEAIDLSGKTDLGQALALLFGSRALVAVDSGILHLGAAAGARVVGLYGPSNWEITGPQGPGHVIVKTGEECSPCVRTECSVGRKCMTNISPEQVIAALEQVLNPAWRFG